MTDTPKRRKRVRSTELVQLMVNGRGLFIYRVANPHWRRPALMRATRFHTNPYTKIVTGVAFVTGPLGWSILWDRA